ncbi:MAG: hypothetical protein HYV09_08805 [Deltaproteobacteria bacterium]|nr:hypothetical protein [Deltaproteobacteria bacterium]
MRRARLRSRAHARRARELSTARRAAAVPREAPPQSLVVFGGLAIAGFVATCAAYQAGALSLRPASALVLAALGAYVWVVVTFARED